MVNKLKSVDWIALVLVIVGGLNWGLVGLLGFDLVAAVLGDGSSLSNVVYIIVGLAAVYLLVVSGKLARK